MKKLEKILNENKLFTLSIVISYLILIIGTILTR